MKKIISCGMAMIVSLAMSAQDGAKVSSQEAFDYNRCSLSVISLNGIAGNAGEVDAWTSTTDFDGKFDMNRITTTSIRTNSDASEIQETLRGLRVGKQILDYWLQYDGNKFDAKLMEQRSRYNATDADVLRDNASKVKTISVANKTLLNNTYVLVTGPTSVEQKTDKKGNITYTASVDAYVYKVNLNDTILTTVWENWLSEDSAPESKNIYENIDVDVDFVAGVKGKIGSGKTSAEALASAFNEVLEPLEKKIDKWQVVTTVYERHPLGAKIGKKEGLKNSDRYRAFKVVEDAEGNLKYKKVGYVRATKVVDNRQDATGEGECSHFYQISGRSIKEGMFLKQKKDIKLSVSAYGTLNGYNIAGIDINYLFKTSQTLGIMQYGGLSIGYDQGDDYTGEKAMYIPISLNYGVGIHPVRILEILPSIGVGADYYGLPSDSEEESEFTKQIAYFARGGVQVGVQVWYPVQIFVRADYSYKISEGELYCECLDHKRFDRLSFGAGLKINF